MRRLFVDIANALDYLHSQKLIHRDIKPANILIEEVDNDYLFKLADFGLSNWDHQAITRCGTPRYLAPKIIARERQTSKVDIYSLGVVLLEILGCLQGLESASPPIEQIHAYVQEAALRLDPTDRANRLVQSMVAKNRNHRPKASVCLRYVGVHPSQMSLGSIPETKAQQGPQQPRVGPGSELHLRPTAERQKNKQTAAPTSKERRAPRTAFPKDLDGDEPRLRRQRKTPPPPAGAGQAQRSQKKPMRRKRELVDSRDLYRRAPERKKRERDDGQLPQALQHKPTPDSKITKRTKKTPRSKLQTPKMPGGWLSSTNL